MEWVVRHRNPETAELQHNQQHPRSLRKVRSRKLQIIQLGMLLYLQKLQKIRYCTLQRRPTGVQLQQFSHWKMKMKMKMKRHNRLVEQRYTVHVL